MESEHPAHFSHLLQIHVDSPRNAVFNLLSGTDMKIREPLQEILLEIQHK